jgi:hypothetical protein
MLCVTHTYGETELSCTIVLFIHPTHELNVSVSQTFISNDLEHIDLGSLKLILVSNQLRESSLCCILFHGSYAGECEVRSYTTISLFSYIYIQDICPAGQYNTTHFLRFVITSNIGRGWRERSCNFTTKHANKTKQTTLFKVFSVIYNVGEWKLDT